MTLIRLIRLPSRYLRRSKGSLFVAVICASLVGLILVVSQLDVPSKIPARVHLAQRVLQQLEQPCLVNCSEVSNSNEAALKSDENGNKFVVPLLDTKLADLPLHLNDLTPEEEAIPEELAPDVEPPQVQQQQPLQSQQAGAAIANGVEEGPGNEKVLEKANNNPAPLFADAKADSGGDIAAPKAVEVDEPAIEVEEPAIEVEDERHLDEVAANQELQQEQQQGKGPEHVRSVNGTSLGTSMLSILKKDDNPLETLEKDKASLKAAKPNEGQVVVGTRVEVSDASKKTDSLVVPAPNASIKNPKTTLVQASAKAVVRAQDLPAVKARKDESSASTPVKPVPESPPILTRELYEPGHAIPGSSLCPDVGRNLKLLVLVTSAPGHGEERHAVRGTWGHVALRNDIALAFFVGKTSNVSEQEHLLKEDIVFGDIIQGNFHDSYNNLTLKTISMLEWVKDHCLGARYVLKTDDDMYINMPKLFAVLEKAQVYKRTILGKVAKKWKPIRNSTSKYYISRTLFSENVYPDFNTGPAYVITSDIITELYEAALQGTFFKLEDVYVTGTIAKRLKVNHVHSNEFVNRRVKLDTCVVQKSVSIHMVKTFEMYDLWKRLSDGLTICPPDVSKTTSKKVTTKPTTRTTTNSSLKKIHVNRP